MIGQENGEEWILKSLDKVIHAQLQKLVRDDKRGFSIISCFTEDRLMITYDVSPLKDSFLNAETYPEPCQTSKMGFV